ncbi:hypothetical protein BRN80_13410, partial [Xanthomonas oryzae pv. oryzae]
MRWSNSNARFWPTSASTTRTRENSDASLRCRCPAIAERPRRLGADRAGAPGPCRLDRMPP